MNFRSEFDYFDLIFSNFQAIWGHEHDCRIVPEQSEKGVWISQPGSSVATSLSEGESLDKNIGVLKVYKTHFRMEPIKLQTVRPFLFETVDLSDWVDELGLNEGDVQEKVLNFCKDKVDKMIESARNKLSGHEKQPQIPRIRLRVLYNEENQLINTIRFGQEYTQRVANPTEIIKFIKNTGKKAKASVVKIDKSAMNDAYENLESRVEDVVDRYFSEVCNEEQQLELFPAKLLSEMCRRLVDNDDENAAEIIIQQQYERSCKYTEEHNGNEENVGELLDEFRDRKANESYDEILRILNNQTSRAPRSVQQTNGRISSDDDDVSIVNTTATGRGGRGRGRATTTSTRGRGRGAKATTNNVSSTLNIRTNVSKDFFKNIY